MDGKGDKMIIRNKVTDAMVRVRNIIETDKDYAMKLDEVNDHYDMRYYPKELWEIIDAEEMWLKRIKNNLNYMTKETVKEVREIFDTTDNIHFLVFTEEDEKKTHLLTYDKQKQTVTLEIWTINNRFLKESIDGYLKEKEGGK